MTTTNEKTNEYWQETADSKRLAILFLSKLWEVIVFVVVGIVAAIAVYFIYHAIADGVSYEAYSEFYLDFATDERGEAYQYYNGYTWNDLMSTDLIAKNTLSNLNGSDFDISKIEQSTYAEIKSDIRVLRDTFTDGNADTCSLLQTATEKSLETLGDTAKEFVSIKTIKSIEPKRVYADNRLLQAILLGAICGLIVALFVLWFRSILDDKVRTPIDLSSFDIPVVGVSLASEDEALQKKLDTLCSNINKAAIDEVAIINVLELVNDAVNINDLANEKAVLDIPYKAVSKRYLAMLVKNLENQNTDIVGMKITLANNSFYRLYL